MKVRYALSREEDHAGKEWPHDVSNWEANKLGLVDRLVTPQRLASQEPDPSFDRMEVGVPLRDVRVTGREMLSGRKRKTVRGVCRWSKDKKVENVPQ